ncbi:hypothetical protein ACFPRA_22720 [Sporosarcina soli]|uniref:Plasmid segregation centromere-binding protein ParR n=1 Tax=Sporosarcina soli TaxID=334736 RepID=A0ABW0TTG2_9BACL
MKVNWEKRYSFRLKEEDEEIYSLLAKVPDSRRSETIRQMLRFAARTISDGQKVNQDNQRLLTELKLLKDNLEKQHRELLERIDSSLAMRGGQQISKSDGESTITEQAIDDSASAMLSSFGVEF